MSCCQREREGGLNGILESGLGFILEGLGGVNDVKEEGREEVTRERGRRLKGTEGKGEQKGVGGEEAGRGRC